MLRVISRDEPSGSKGEALDAEPYRQKFIEAMDDDFNTPQALAALFDLARDINRADEAGFDATGARDKLKELGEIIGLTFKLPEKPSIDAQSYSDIISCITALPPGAAQWKPAGNESYIEHLARLRNQLRADKQWQQADIIRSKLAESGVAIEDTPKGTVWKYRRQPDNSP